MNTTSNTLLSTPLYSTVRSQRRVFQSAYPPHNLLTKRRAESGYTAALRGALCRLTPFTSRRIASSSRHILVNAAASTYSKDTPHLQLATARLRRCCLIWVPWTHHMPISVECIVLLRLVLDAEVLCSGVDIPTFASKMYQWASTLTYQGRNMPFCLPFRTDPLDTGFVVKQ